MNSTLHKLAERIQLVAERLHSQTVTNQVELVQHGFDAPIAKQADDLQHLLLRYSSAFAIERTTPPKRADIPHHPRQFSL